MLINRDKFDSFCLSSMLALSFFRSTSMWFGYPSAQHQLAQITYMPQKLMQILVMLLLITYFVFSGYRLLLDIRLKKVEWLVIACIFFSVILSEYKLLSMRYFISFLVITLPPILYYHRYGPEALLVFITKIISLTVIANFIYVLASPDYAIMSGVHEGAWRGMFVHKNVAGAYFALVSVIFVSKWFYLEKLRTNYDLILFVLCCVMVFASKSMTAVLTFFFVHLSFWLSYLILKHSLVSQRLFIVTTYLLALVAGGFVVSTYFDELMILLGRDPSLTGRTGLWEVLLPLVMERPVFGYGIGVFSRPEIMYEYSVAFGWMAKSTHSSFLDILLGVGIIGATSVLAWLFYCLFSTLLKQVITARYAFQLSGAVSVIIGCLIIATSSSGVLISANIFWILIICMVYFCYSQEVIEE
ncbi:O-antigen ligase family protein [Vibrio maritimus]|uniref:O-antigen ligase family protein n=1 Tax=Vibrio maritimus TaxID=990268 RepID=UPI00406953E7